MTTSWEEYPEAREWLARVRVLVGSGEVTTHGRPRQALMPLLPEIGAEAIAHLALGGSPVEGAAAARRDLAAAFGPARPEFSHKDIERYLNEYGRYAARLAVVSDRAVRLGL